MCGHPKMYFFFSTSAVKIYVLTYNKLQEFDFNKMIMQYDTSDNSYFH